MNIETGIALVNRNNLKISIPVHFDNGFKSDLYNASRYLGTGISLYYRKSKDVFLTFEAHDILQINNGVKDALVMTPSVANFTAAPVHLGSI